MRILITLCCILSISILGASACQSTPVGKEKIALTQKEKREKIKFLTDEAIKPFIGQTVGVLLDSISLKQEKHIYFQEPPGLWAGCCYFFSNEQGLYVFVDDFQYHDQRDKKTVPNDEAFSKEIITGFRIIEWER
ncbi:MAG TPA: hypothetical protein PLT63_09305 [Syntrophales bacterium]|nr:hypothetical protein [Syntrophales bacterium]